MYRSEATPPIPTSKPLRTDKFKAKLRGGLRLFLFLASLLFLAPSAARALQTSPHALRLEDKKAGNVLLGAELSDIEAGEVYKTVVLAWGDLAIHGQVEEVVVLSGKVIFHPGAKLGKSLVIMGGGFESLPGANVADDKVSLRSPGPLWRALRGMAGVWRENVGWVAALIGAAASCLVLWLLGVVAYLIFPALPEASAEALGARWATNLLFGMLGSIAVPVVGVLLVISIFGILVLPIYLFLLAFAGLVSYLGAALWAGHRLLPPRGNPRINYVGFFLGLAAFQLFWMVGGWALLPVILLWTLSWGSLLASLRRRPKPPRAR